MAHLGITTKTSLVTRTSTVEDHALAGMDNSMSAGIKEDPGWGVPAHI